MKMRSYLLLVLVVFFSLRTPAQFDPVSFESDNANIRLSVLGSFRGITFARNTPASPPGYDPLSKRLFVGSVDENVINVLDVSDPTTPNNIFNIDLNPYGDEAQSIGVKNGIVAVAVLQTDGLTATTNVVFFDINGKLLARPVFINGEANKLVFTPNGRVVAVSITGRPTDDYTIDPEGAVAVIELFDENIFTTYLSTQSFHCGTANCDLDPSLDIAKFTVLNSLEGTLRRRGVRIFGPGATVAQDLEPQSLTVDEFFAYVSLTPNNAIAVVSLPFKFPVNVYGLGEKDHSLPENAIDVSDRDGIINITTWPLTSLYEPDGIKTFRRGLKTFIVTANEGDPRDFDGFSEIERGEDLVLDPTVFPNAEELQARENLGRIRLTKVNTDIDGDGDIDRLQTLGSRSFSIRNVFGRLIYDSGSDFETITAQAVPDFFNAAADENNFDNRSDDRGPEPEPLDLGVVGHRRYAFIGFERISGVMVYDITRPRSPSFQQYINNRNFAIDPDNFCEKEEVQSDSCRLTGDLEVEGILFISEDDSPIDEPILVVSHEASNSVTLYTVEEVEKDDDEAELQTIDIEDDRASSVLQLQALSAQAGMNIGDVLSYASPNPFVNEINIEFFLPEKSQTRIQILNSLGQTVKEFQTQELAAGEQSITWKGSDNEGNRLSPGVYIYQIRTPQMTLSNKIIKAE